jgi:hypothetical protein
LANAYGISTAATEFPCKTHDGISANTDNKLKALVDQVQASLQTYRIFTSAIFS